VLRNAIIQYADAYCRKYQSCQPGSFSYSVGTLDECNKRMLLANAWIAALPDTTWDAAAFKACGAAYQSGTCSNLIGAGPAACIHAGLRKTGDACNMGEQCASYSCKATGFACGTCGATPVVGTTCASGAECGPNLTCSAANTCQTPRGPGAACSASAPCRSDLACYKSVCTTLPATVGATCDTAGGLDCNFAANLLCSAGKCIRAVAATTSSCGTTSTTATYCPKKGYCSAGTCTPAAADHAACDTTKQCEWPATCISGTCKIPSDLGECK
jgi:hypothetical protein